MLNKLLVINYVKFHSTILNYSHLVKESKLLYWFNNLWFGLSHAAPTLSEDEDDDAGHDNTLAWDDSSIHVASGGTPVTGSFVPAIGGPFSALTPSMWPQDILSRIQQVHIQNYVNCLSCLLWASLLMWQIALFVLGDIAGPVNTFLTHHFVALCTIWLCLMHCLPNPCLWLLCNYFVSIINMYTAMIFFFSIYRSICISKNCLHKLCISTLQPILQLISGCFTVMCSEVCWEFWFLAWHTMKPLTSQ